MTVTGKITLNKTIKSTKFVGEVLPSGVELNAFIDDKNRIYAQHSVKTGIYLLVKAGDITTSTWSNGEEMLNKPMFHEVQLKPFKKGILPTKYTCSDCGNNEWIY